MKSIQHITDILDHYDGFIIDLWGVIHDGTSAYPGAKAAMAALHQAGKQVVFLSNAPRRAEKARNTLDNFHIPREQYIDVISSGEVAFQHLSRANPYGPRYYYLGPDKDSGVFTGAKTALDFDENVLQDAAEFTRVMDEREADFILCAGFEYDYQPLDEFEPVAQRLAVSGKPMVCINPDLEVVKMDGTRLWCAGWVARRYAELGGTVTYYGKPHADVYATAFNILGALDHSRILAIGDNLLTDILGANAQGIDSLLITGGILTAEAGHAVSEAELEAALRDVDAEPTYLAALFQ